MKIQQLIRIDKIQHEHIYLLTKNKETNKHVFEICGSTKNVYKVQLYKKSKMIYCNCPDSKVMLTIMELFVNIYVLFY